jgi:DNA-binding NarL/FixJ family response regulator
MSAKVVILAGRSLFTQGVISKLRGAPTQRNFEVIDLCQPDALQAIEAACPDVIVVDGNDPEFIAQIKGSMFPNLSQLKIIFLNSKTSRTRILQWEEHDTIQINDLLDEISATEESRNSKTYSAQPDAGMRSNTNLVA